MRSALRRMLMRIKRGGHGTGAPREKPLAKLIRLSVAWADQLSLLLTAVGLLGLLLLPLVERRAKFDEKALMVGSVMPTITGDAHALAPGLALARAVHELQHSAQRNTTSMPLLLQQHMQRMGLDAHLTTTCRAAGELAVSAGSATGDDRPEEAGQQGGCISVHGLLTAPQTDGTEALLLVTPVSLTTGDIEGRSAYWDAPAAGAPLLLGAVGALLHHLAHHTTWLARDIVWVVPDARCGATASLAHWAQHYHGKLHPGHAGGNGLLLGGVLQQALVLQADRINISTAEVLVMGFDGLLPKLDTYLVLRDLLYVFHDVRVQDLPTSPAAAAVEKLLVDHKLGGAQLQWHVRRLGHMLSFLGSQLLGLPSGPHAALKEYMVDAATARFSGQAPPPSDPQPGSGAPALSRDLPRRVTQVAQYAELVVRAFNNLDERFHHSFFLYLFTLADHFVSVEMYILPLVALIMALVLKAAKQRDHLRSPLPPPQPTVPGTADAASAADNAAGGATGAVQDTATAASTQATCKAAVDNPARPAEVERAGKAGQGPGHAAGAAGVGTANSPGASSPAWGPAILVALFMVTASVSAGALLRVLACPACRLCSYQLSPACCASITPLTSASALQCGDGAQGTCPANSDFSAPTAAAGMLQLHKWAAGLLPASVLQLGPWQLCTLLVSTSVAGVTLGWEAYILARNAMIAAHTAQEAASPGMAHGATSTQKLVVGQPAFWGAVRVVLLSAAAVMLTGMASVNWALAYGIAASLGLLVVASPAAGAAASGGRSGRPRAVLKARLQKVLLGTMRFLAMLLTSPVAHLMLLGVSSKLGWDAVGPLPNAETRLEAAGRLVTWVRHAVCCSWSTTYYFWLAAYLPFWLFEVIVHR